LQNQRFLRVALVVLVVTLFGNITSPSRGNGPLNSASLQSAKAAPATSSPIYLPIVMFHWPPGTVFGVEMHNISSAGGLDVFAQAKTTWLRRNALLWSDIEPTEGFYNWGAAASLEQEMINASQKGLDLILVVRGTPTWAQKLKDTSCGPVSQNKLQAFGNFMYEAVKRYSVAPYNVRNWQIWNEPDADPHYVSKDSVYGCWGDQTDSFYGGTYYTEALKALYPRVKQANPLAQVIIGGLLLDSNSGSNQKQFLAGVLRHQDQNGNYDGKNYFDGVAFHAYDIYGSQLGAYSNSNWGASWNTTGPVLSVKAEFVKGVLASYNAADKYLMNTEAAVRLCNVPPNDNFNTTKAYYIAQLYAVSIVEGLKATIWYDDFGGWCNTGLLNPNLSTTQAFTAFQVARDTLRDAGFIRNLDMYPGVKGYEFDRGNRHIWILWSLDGNDHNITLPATPLSGHDVFNNPITINGTSLTVTLAPVYLEWNP
jgi:hypothetical protein